MVYAIVAAVSLLVFALRCRVEARAQKFTVKASSIRRRG